MANVCTKFCSFVKASSSGTGASELELELLLLEEDEEEGGSSSSMIIASASVAR
jgi:hypothetical protein